ncbi:mannose-1-phosphate guanylyltransferase [Croceiramulus getboli]|nr:sugar phosphate nucleotidyltransferase [Flavobacteriaceae bacterium YJPT1-3]
MKVNHVVLTGGVGSRLWPLSRKNKPKQYLDIFEGESLFEKTIKRNAKFTDHLLVVGNIENEHWSKVGLKNLKIDKATLLTETVAKNTAAAVAFAAMSSQPNDILLVTPADHIIKEGESYDRALRRAFQLARDGALVTFGVFPKEPETGFGYIEFDGEKVISYKEKPTRELAKRYVESGGYLWNSGMFCFKAQVYLAELERLAPAIFKAASAAFEQRQGAKMNASASEAIPNVSIDYAVMEKSDLLKVVPSHFEWSDMGSYTALYDYLKGSGHPIDSKGNMFIGSGRPAFFIGLQNCIVVDTADSILIVRKENAQDVKDIYDQLSESHPELL